MFDNAEIINITFKPSLIYTLKTKFDWRDKYGRIFEGLQYLTVKPDREIFPRK
jgi:hypothetical protein